MRRHSHLLCTLAAWAGFAGLFLYICSGSILLFPLGAFGLVAGPVGLIGSLVQSLIAVWRGDVRASTLASHFLAAFLLCLPFALVFALVQDSEPWGPGAFSSRDGAVVCLAKDGTYRWTRGQPPGRYAPAGSWTLSERPDNDLEFEGRLACATTSLRGRNGFHLHDSAETYFEHVGPCAEVSVGE